MSLPAGTRESHATGANNQQWLLILVAHSVEVFYGPLTLVPQLHLTLQGFHLPMLLACFQELLLGITPVATLYAHDAVQATFPEFFSSPARAKPCSYDDAFPAAKPPTS